MTRLLDRPRTLPTVAERYWLVDADGNPTPGSIFYGPVLGKNGEPKMVEVTTADGLIDVSKLPKAHDPVIEDSWHSLVATASHPLTDKDPKGK